MAANSLGRLTLDLLVQTAEFTGPLSQAERQARTASKNIASSFDIATFAAKTLGAVVAGVSVASLVEFANQTIETGSEIKKFAQLSNTSVREFQYYAKGAETAGISMESFADKMKDMQDRIGDFQQTGGGPLADFFENIAPLVGVTIQQFQKLSGPQALQLYYDSLQKVGASQNDMKFYMEAIISDSSLLIPLLQNGGEGFKKWGEAAEQANAILSEDMIQNLALAKENLRLMDLQWQGLEARLINNVVPVVKAVANNMDDIKAITIALAAAIGSKLVVQGAILAGTFTMAAIRGAAMELTLMGMQRQALGAATSMGVLRGVMGFLGGPAGLAMLAVQGVAAGAAFYYMKKSSDELDPSLTIQQKSVAELRAEYEKLDATQQRVLTRKATDTLETANQLYREQKNEMLGLIDAITRSSKVSENDKQIAEGLFERYRLGKIDANQLANAINGLATVSDSAKASIDNKAKAVMDEAGKVVKAQSILDVYTGKVQNNTKANNDNAKSIGEQEKALLSLTQKQREALKDIQGQLDRESYIQASMRTGISREHAEYYADYKDNAGIPYFKPLSNLEVKLVEQGYKLKEQTKDREESEKKIEETKKRQLELTQKQALVVASGNETSRNMLKVYQAFMNTGVFSDQQARYLTAEVGRENDFRSSKMFGSHKDKNNGFTNVGIMSWQKSRAKDLMSMLFSKGLLDNKGAIKETQESLNAQALFLAKEVFTDPSYTKSKNALLSNAGYKELEKIFGKNYVRWDYEGRKIKAGPHHKKRDNYYNQLNTLLGDGTTTNISSAIQSFSKLDDELANVAERLKNDKRTLVEYYDEWQKISNANDDKVNEIGRLYADDPVMRDRLLKLQAEAYAKDVENYIKAQDEKVAAQRKVAWEILEAQYSVINASKAMDDQIRGLSSGADDIFAKATMSPNDYAMWSLANQKSNAQLALSNQRVAVEQGIMTSDSFSSDDERYQALLQAHEEYLIQKNALDVQYDQQVKDLQKSQFETQLGLWSTLLGQAQNTWSQMTQSVKTAQGEQSSAYKAMFLMQQSIAIASAIVSAHLAAVQTTADITLPFVGKKSAANAILAFGYANAAMIGAQTIAGMAHDGIDNIPREGTWLLDGGERVLNPQQNKDLTNYLSNQKNSGPQVVINNMNGSRVSQRQGADGKLYVDIDDVEGFMVGALSDPNSKVSKAMQHNYNAQRRR
ncbi:hypothetical protein [Acinetobacter baumannii]|uniref:hypothetical protein n=1 Tax=Acinetobacter baumannii TaxID=470 RepID=UPI0024433B77|nr:hypothetical protein [Acinetobacter baumannii]MDH7582685.1 hypothetical protein [Acinetobacter baumannii]WGF68152.1 hypothetical protein QCC48_10355 [Acinetobacter baumannii]HCP6178785.1 hypothetical protein [Acinetobacter baumannii]